MVKAALIISDCEYALSIDGGYIWGKYGQTWTKKDQDNLVSRMIKLFGSDWQTDSAAKDDDYYMGAKYGSKWIGHRVWDCSGLIRWAMAQHDLSVAHGSNSIYDRYCSSKGTLTAGKRTDGKTIKPGSAVFTSNPSTGKKPHVGVYTGNGFIIEAASTQKGVVKSKITDKNSSGKYKWTYWGELKGLDYDEGDETMTPDNPVMPPEEDGKTNKLPTLRKGDKGDTVKYLQTLLLDRGYSLPKYGADGDFGNETLKAVKAFQKDWGLAEDGVVGEKTWERLTTAPEKPKFYTVTITHRTKDEADEIVNKYGGVITAE